MNESNNPTVRASHKGLDGTMLKYIAIIAMVIDHIAGSFVTDGTALSIVMHMIGRITGPTMFYFAVEGYHKTSNINRYMLRLGAFALISYFPFLYYRYGGVLADIQLLRPNVIYTIFMGISKTKHLDIV